MNMTNLETIKVLKNLRGLKNLRNFVIESKEAKGMIHNFNESKSKIENKTTLDVRILRKFANELLLVSLPDCLKSVWIKTYFREKDFKYLCYKMYRIKYTPDHFFNKIKQDCPLVQYLNKLK